MITRDVGQLRVVKGYNQPVTTATTTGDGAENRPNYIGPSYTIFDASCGSLNGDSTANAVAGTIIDRLGLGRSYNSVSVAVTGALDIGTTTKDTAFGAVYAWLYHSSTTCAFDFDRYSTESERSRGIAFMLNTTSTLASGYMATSTSVGTWGTFSASATGEARADYNASYDLTGAGRYLRPYLFVEAYASSSGGSAFPSVSVDLVFGEPDQAPRTTTSTDTLYKSS